MTLPPSWLSSVLFSGGPLDRSGKHLGGRERIITSGWCFLRETRSVCYWVVADIWLSQEPESEQRRWPHPLVQSL